MFPLELLIHILLKSLISSCQNLVLIIFFQPLVKEIDGPNSPVGIRSAMHSVIALGNEAGMGSSGSSKAGNAICGLLAKEGCVRALLRQCLPNVQRNQDIRILALRGLSAICCVADCIREFEKVNFQIFLSQRGSENLKKSRHKTSEIKQINFTKSIFCNFKNGQKSLQKSIFELGKTLKLPKMQFHEKMIVH